MVRSYRKGMVQKLGNGEFSVADFDCHCTRPECDVTLVDDDLLEGLQELTDILGKPRIDSGFRCAAHNKEVGGVPDSQHTLGKASDLSSPFNTVDSIAACAERIEPFENGGIGIYSKFVHVDSRGHKARWFGPKAC